MDNSTRPLLRDKFTDMGNTERLVKRYGDSLRYVVEAKRFYSWDQNRWVLVPDELVEAMTKEVILRMYDDASAAQSGIEGELLSKHAKRSEGSSRIKAAVALAKSDRNLMMHQSQFDKNGYLLNVENGTVNLLTGELKPHEKTDYITKLAPVRYDASATYSNWQKFLERIFNNDAALIEYVQKLLGYCLTGDTKEQCFFMFIGGGMNGKSTLLGVIESILGNYFQQATGDLLTVKNASSANNDVARLRGIRLLSLSEMEQDKPFAESLVKQLTGGEKVTARFLYGEFFEFTPLLKLIISSNHAPNIRNSDSGIWRRVVRVPFSVSIPPEERDYELKNKLIAEKSGILNWLIEGSLKWQREGLKQPRTVREATESYRKEADTVHAFISEVCLEEPQSSTQAKELYEHFCKWVAAKGLELLTQKEFGTRLSQMGYSAKKKSGTITRIGLAIRITLED